MQRGNRGDQIHAGLSGVEQRSGRLQVQRSPAASRDPLNEKMGARLAFVHGAQQTAVRDTGRAPEHAMRARRALSDVRRSAAGGRPRRCCRQNDVDDERDERQGDEPSDKRRPVASVAQPEHSGDDIGQNKKRHVDAADNHFPPRWLWHLEALLQPHRRDGAEEQPAIRPGLELPQGVRTDKRRRPSAQVVDHEYQRERQPIAHHREHLVPATDAGSGEPGGDVEQQQFPVESQPVGQGPVGHDQGPDGNRRPAGQRQAALVRRRVSVPQDPDRLDRHGRERPGDMRLRARRPRFARHHLDPSAGCNWHQNDSCRRQKAFPRTSCRNLRRQRFNLWKDTRCQRRSQGCRLVSSTARRGQRGIAPASNPAQTAPVRRDARVGDSRGNAGSGCRPSGCPNTRRFRGQYGATGLPQRQARGLPLRLHFPLHCSGQQARGCEHS